MLGGAAEAVAARLAQVGVVADVKAVPATLDEIMVLLDS